MAIDKIPFSFSQKKLRFFANRVKKERNNATDHKWRERRKKRAEKPKYFIDIVEGFIGNDDAYTKKKADNPDADIRLFHYKKPTSFHIDYFYYKAGHNFCKARNQNLVLKI